MAIFAKKHEGKGGKGGMNLNRDAVDVDIEGTSAATGEGRMPSDGSGDEQQGEMRATESDQGGETVVETPLVDPAVTATPLVDHGVVKPVVVDSVDIEPEVIDPEAVEAVAETNGSPAFGIADAIRLMRSLPADPNIELVVRVVRVTLGAVNVSVEDIMQDAARKEKAIQDSIAALQGQVEELEKQLYAKRCEIAAQESDLNETVTVRERLHMADKYTGHRPPPTPPDATRHGNPKPSEWAAEWDRSQQIRVEQAQAEQTKGRANQDGASEG